MVITPDNVTDAQRILGAQFVESVFYRQALEEGFGHDSERRARELFQMWLSKGYVGLPLKTKQFILAVCNSERRELIPTKS